jgi:recombination protein RecA
MAEINTKAFNAAQKSICENMGEDALFIIGKNKPVANVDVFPSGSLGLDIATGVWGIPRGRVVEFHGKESGGKSTLAMHTIANAQRAGFGAAYVDAEHSFDPHYARKIGINLDYLLVNQPSYGEEAIAIMEQLIVSKGVGIIVVDSVAALTPKAIIDGDVGDAHVGVLARLLSPTMGRITDSIYKENVCIIFINQLRDKIGSFSPGAEQTDTPGGRALKHHASLRIKIERIGGIKDNDRQVGSRTRATVKKNKLNAPFTMAEFDLRFGEGISMEGEVLDLGVDAGLLKKDSGANYAFGKTTLGHGREKARLFLKKNPQITQELSKAILEAKKKESVTI